MHLQISARPSRKVTPTPDAPEGSHWPQPTVTPLANSKQSPLHKPQAKAKEAASKDFKLKNVDNLEEKLSEHQPYFRDLKAYYTDPAALGNLFKNQQSAQPQRTPRSNLTRRSQSKKRLANHSLDTKFNAHLQGQLLQSVMVQRRFGRPKVTVMDVVANMS